MSGSGLSQIDWGAGDLCEFCMRIHGDSHTRQPYDFRVLWEDEYFLAVPALGSLVPGYLLIVSRPHIPSMASQSAARIRHLQDFTAHLSRIVKQCWSAPIVFEHGSCARGRIGACIVHAHWHLVPGGWDVVTEDLAFRSAASFLDVARLHRDRGYLFLRDAIGRCFVSDDAGTASQFFRRRIAAELGRPLEWDYTLFPHLANVHETIKVFDGLL